MRDTYEVLGQIVFKFISGRLGWLKAISVLGLFVGLLWISFYFINLYFNSETQAGTRPAFSELVFEALFGIAITNGGLNLMSIIFWGGTIASFTLPVVSNSILTTYNRSSMVSVKNNDIHKITDSIALQYTSILTIIQLLMLTIFTSILKYTYDLSPLVYLFAIAVWMLFGLLTVLLAWVTDYLLRKYNAVVKAVFVIAELTILACLFFFIPESSGTFFGLSSLVLESFNDSNTLLILIASFFALCFVLIGLIMFFGLLTINTTAPFVSNKRLRKKSFVPSWLLTLRVLFRNGNVKSPIILMILVISGSLILSSNTPTLFGFIFALPMVITMAWMVNVYGIIGNGNGWLFSLKGFARKGLAFFGIINVFLIASAMTIISSVALIMDILPLKDTLRFFFSSMVAGVIMTLLAALYSIYRPIKYDVHIRGENILPPSRSLFILGLFMALGGLPSMYAFAFLDVFVLSGVLAFMLALLPFALLHLNKKVSEGLIMNDIIAATN